MKVLSVRQPWAWFLAHGWKDIENRTWSTRIRGPVLIHASGTMTRREYDDAMRFAIASSVVPYSKLPKADELERGGIVGIVNLIDCVPPERRASPWHMEGQFGFHMIDAKPIPFIPCKGALSFFNVPPEVEALLPQSIRQGIAA